jgi:hypothetical protein
VAFLDMDGPRRAGSITKELGGSAGVDENVAGLGSGTVSETLYLQNINMIELKYLTLGDGCTNVEQEPGAACPTWLSFCTLH